MHLSVFINNVMIFYHIIIYEKNIKAMIHFDFHILQII